MMKVWQISKEIDLAEEISQLVQLCWYRKIKFWLIMFGELVPICQIDQTLVIVAYIM